MGLVSYFFKLELYESRLVLAGDIFKVPVKIKLEINK